MPELKKTWGYALLQFLLFASVCFAATDTIPPTGTIKINNDAQYATTAATTLNLSAQDNSGGSGMGTGAQMLFSNDGTAWSIAEAYAVTKVWSLPAGDGIKTVYVKFKDAVGNWSLFFMDSIILDTTKPTGSININNNAASTNSTQVNLVLFAFDAWSVSQMQLSNDNVNWSSLEPYNSSKSWALTSGGGTKTVYVKFKDAAGNWSSVYSDSIVLDTSPATTPVVTDEGQITNRTDRLSASWVAEDKESGIVEYMYQITSGSINGAVMRSWTSTGKIASVTATNLTLVDNTTYFFAVKALNGVGLWSNIGYADGITKKSDVDVTAPTGTIKINNDNQYTKYTAVTLNLSATDTASGMGSGAQMQFSNDNKTWSAAEAYAVTKRWTLTSGNGTKTVYVKFKDVAGNWSSVYADTIILDMARPPEIVKISPESSASAEIEEVNFTGVFSDDDGWQDIQWAQFLVNNKLAEASSCLVGYNQNKNLLYLKSDDGVKWLGGYAPGAKNIIENSQAKLNCAQTTVTGKSNTLTVNFKIAFKTTFVGVKNTYLLVQDDLNNTSGWQQKGTFCIFRKPISPPG